MHLRTFVLAAALVTGTAITAACGDDGDKAEPTPVPTLNILREIPPDFPKDFPAFDGATFKGGVSEGEGGLVGTIAIWDTTASIDEVKAFYDAAFAAGPWTSPPGTVTDSSVYWSATSPDGSQVAGVNVVRDGEKTVINATVTEAGTP